MQTWDKRWSLNPVTRFWAAGGFQRCMESCQCALLLPAPSVAQTEHVYSKATGATWVHVKSSYDVSLHQVSFLQHIATWTAPCVWSQSTDCYCLSRRYNSASQGKIHQPLPLASSKWRHNSNGSPLLNEPSGKYRQGTMYLTFFFPSYVVAMWVHPEQGRWQSIIRSRESKCHALG